MRSFLKTKTAMVLALTVTAGAASADGHGDVEVLHWWTSGGEAAALNVLKDDLEGQGIGWTDMPVAGGGGEQAMTVLRARVTAGNAPTAVQGLGFDIIDWADQGSLANLNDVAAAEGHQVRGGDAFVQGAFVNDGDGRGHGRMIVCTDREGHKASEGEHQFFHSSSFLFFLCLKPLLQHLIIVRLWPALTIPASFLLKKQLLLHHFV